MVPKMGTNAKVWGNRPDAGEMRLGGDSAPPSACRAPSEVQNPFCSKIAAGVRLQFSRVFGSLAPVCPQALGTQFWRATPPLDLQACMSGAALPKGSAPSHSKQQNDTCLA